MQDHVAPLGSQDCVAFSSDASMLSCVSSTEVKCIQLVPRRPLTSSNADLDVEFAPIGVSYSCVAVGRGSVPAAPSTASHIKCGVKT